MNKSGEKEVRLPSSNKIYENIKNDVPSIPSKNKSSINSSGLINDKNSISGSKNQIFHNAENETSLPNIGQKNGNSSSKLVKKFQDLTKAENSHSMVNLLASNGDKMSTKGKIQKNASIKISSDYSIFNLAEELDEATIESKMKTLPHWKYGASFDNYINACTCVTEEIKKEFMKLYKKK